MLDWPCLRSQDALLTETKNYILVFLPAEPVSYYYSVINEFGSASVRLYCLLFKFSSKFLLHEDDTPYLTLHLPLPLGSKKYSTRVNGMLIFALCFPCCAATSNIMCIISCFATCIQKYNAQNQ